MPRGLVLSCGGAEEAEVLSTYSYVTRGLLSLERNPNAGGGLKSTPLAGWNRLKLGCWARLLLLVPTDPCAFSPGALILSWRCF